SDALHDREDHLVVQDDLRGAADGRGGEDLAARVLLRLKWTEGAGLETPDRVDATREVALEQRQLVAVDAGVADAVRDIRAERVGEVAETLRAQEGVVPALARLGLDEALAAETCDLDRHVLRRTGGWIEGVVHGVARHARCGAADQARGPGLPGCPPPGAPGCVDCPAPAPVSRPHAG